MAELQDTTDDRIQALVAHIKRANEIGASLAADGWQIDILAGDDGAPLIAEFSIAKDLTA